MGWLNGNCVSSKMCLNKEVLDIVNYLHRLLNLLLTLRLFYIHFVIAKNKKRISSLADLTVNEYLYVIPYK